MTDVLMVSFDEYLINTSDTSAGEGKFDHSLFATHSDIDKGYAVTDDDVAIRALTEGDGEFKESLSGNPARKTTSRLNADNYLLDFDTFTENVVCPDGTKVSVADYETIVVSHTPFHVSYVQYLRENYPGKTLVGLQNETTTLATSGSPTYTLEHYQALQQYDGFVATTEDYRQWVSGIVEDTTFIPVFVPPGHFEDVSPVDLEDRRDAALIGGTSWHLDHENVYSNFAVLNAVRERGHDIDGEIAGVRNYQLPRVKPFEERHEFVSVYPFLANDADFYEYLSGLKMGVQLSRNRSWGRVAAELAALNVPCIGSKYDTYQSECWPDLSVDPTDVTEAISLAERLLEDEEFYAEVVEKANRTLREFQDASRYVDEFTSFIDRLD